MKKGNPKRRKRAKEEARLARREEERQDAVRYDRQRDRVILCDAMPPLPPRLEKPCQIDPPLVTKAYRRPVWQAALLLAMLGPKARPR